MEAVGHNLRSSSGTVAPRNRKGFNLIEAAIVLAVVGLVVAGIWWAASALASKWKVDKAVEYLTVIEQGTRAKMPIQTYTGDGSTPYNHVANTLAAMKIIPEVFKTSEQVSMSHEGIRLQVRLEGYGANVLGITDGPVILIVMFTENYGYGSTLTINECTSLVKKIIARNRRNTLFYKVGMFNPVRQYTSSSDLSSVQCPDTTSQIYFVFKR